MYSPSTGIDQRCSVAPSFGLPVLSPRVNYSRSDLHCCTWVKSLDLVLAVGSGCNDDNDDQTSFPFIEGSPLKNLSCFLGDALGVILVVVVFRQLVILFGPYFFWSFIFFSFLIFWTCASSLSGFCSSQCVGARGWVHLILIYYSLSKRICETRLSCT